MASESEPMDIEEEVDEIDQEIKKPEDEGRVPNAERELNYQRKPSAEDLKAPDVFRGMRNEIIPILRFYNTPTGLPENPKDKKVLPKPPPKPPKGSQAAHLEANPDTVDYSFYKSQLIKFMEKLKKVSGTTERQDTMNERGTQRGGMGSGVTSQRTRNRNEKLQHEKLHSDDVKPEKTPRKQMSAEALERRRLNFEKPKTRKHTDLRRRKYRNQSETKEETVQLEGKELDAYIKRRFPNWKRPTKKTSSFTNSLLELNEKLKRGGESIGSDSKQSGKAPFKGGAGTADRKVNRLSAGDQTKKPKMDKEGNLVPNRSTTGTGKKDKPTSSGVNFRANRRSRVGGAMGGLKIRESKPVVTASSRTGGAGAPKVGDRTPSQTRSGQQRAAKRGIKLNVVNRFSSSGTLASGEFDNPDDPVAGGQSSKKMPQLGADLSDKKISTNKPSMATRKPAKRTGLGTSGLGSGVGSPISRANNREWFSEVYGI